MKEDSPLDDPSFIAQGMILALVGAIGLIVYLLVKFSPHDPKESYLWKVREHEFYELPRTRVLKRVGECQLIIKNSDSFTCYFDSDPTEPTQIADDLIKSGWKLLGEGAEEVLWGDSPGWSARYCKGNRMVRIRIPSRPNQEKYALSVALVRLADPCIEKKQ